MDTTMLFPPSVHNIRVTDPVLVSPIQVSRGYNIGRGDAKKCSAGQVKHYINNWNKILPPRVIRSVKRHGDVMHGARSVNMIVGEKYSRSTKDFDIYSRSPFERANDIENQIDRACGCDMAYVHRQPIPKFNVFAPEDPFSANEVFIVKTIPSKDGDVDYMKLPRGLPYHKRKGIYHENLEEAYRKAKRNIMHPLRSYKARKDINRIEAYWRSRGRRI